MLKKEDVYPSEFHLYRKMPCGAFYVATPNLYVNFRIKPANLRISKGTTGAALYWGKHKITNN
jgi:hypothetical protein